MDIIIIHISKINNTVSFEDLERIGNVFVSEDSQGYKISAYLIDVYSVLESLQDLGVKVTN